MYVCMYVCMYNKASLVSHKDGICNSHEFLTHYVARSLMTHDLGRRRVVMLTYNRKKQSKGIYMYA